jgi:hypothetical protein
LKKVRRARFQTKFRAFSFQAPPDIRAFSFQAPPDTSLDKARGMAIISTRFD